MKEIKSSFIISSSIPIKDHLKAEERVIALCKARHADTYINPIGGVELYEKENFRNEGINLHFLKTGDVKYMQFNNDFIPMLSIIDVIMFNSKEEIKTYLTSRYSFL